MNTWIVGEDLIKLHFLMKKKFYGRLNLKDTTVVDYRHLKRVLFCA